MKKEIKLRVPRFHAEDYPLHTSLWNRLTRLAEIHLIKKRTLGITVDGFLNVGDDVILPKDDMEIERLMNLSTFKEAGEQMTQPHLMLSRTILNYRNLTFELNRMASEETCTTSWANSPFNPNNRG